MSKATGKELELHQNILEGNHLALSQLYDLEGQEVVLLLKNKFPKVAQRDASMILDAVNQAFLSYSRKPEGFNPELKSLKQFLLMVATRDLLNILEGEKKHLETRQSALLDVELEEEFWNNKVRTEINPESELVHREILNKIESILHEHFNGETDIEMALMIIRSDKKTEDFSKLLGIEHLPKDEQEREVKRHKDRIKKVFLRNDLLNKIKRVYER